MPKFFVEDAAQRFGKSRAHLYKLMKSGQLSYVIEDGRRVVDFSELIRVLGQPVSPKTELERQSLTSMDSKSTEWTAAISELKAELAAAQATAAQLELRLSDERDRRQRAERDADSAKEQIQLLLEDKTAQPGFFRKLFGG
jgi:hypothetical protein